MDAVEIVAYLAFASGAVAGACTVGLAYWVNNGRAAARARRSVAASRKGPAL